jgi:hypothetical protein
MLGLTVLPEYIQSEGVETLLDHLQDHLPITSIATSPYVMIESDPDRGQREPPADAGSGSKRLLDRPLWGKREIWVEAAPSFVPNLKHYESCRYRPAPASELTEREGAVVGQFIAAAKKRGIEVLLQIQAAIPPGYRVQFGGPVDADRPMLPDGSFPSQRLALNGSLASDDILSYGEGLIRDLLEQYPDAAGVRVDWPEYPPYFFDDLFVDFNPQVRPFAEELGMDFELLSKAVTAIRDDLFAAESVGDLVNHLDRLRENINDLVRLKGTLVQNLMRRYRAVVGRDKKLIPGIFPAPWDQLAGSSPENLAAESDAIFCKLYTMHWPMIVDHYRTQLLEAKPDWNPTDLTRVLVEWLGIDEWQECEGRYTYPDPSTAHPVSGRLQGEKIRQAQDIAGDVPVVPIAHSYGPADDFRNRLKVAWGSSDHGIWVNRYAYVSDEKLAVIGETCR